MRVLLLRHFGREGQSMAPVAVVVLMAVDVDMSTGKHASVTHVSLFVVFCIS